MDWYLFYGLHRSDFWPLANCHRCALRTFLFHLIGPWFMKNKSFLHECFEDEPNIFVQSSITTNIWPIDHIGDPPGQQNWLYILALPLFIQAGFWRIIKLSLFHLKCPCQKIVLYAWTDVWASRLNKKACRAIITAWRTSGNGIADTNH